tara:strand:+ start:10790 stop:11629 length:840 start_codon:yes stop_codon:yes gene_type:complete
MSEFSHNRRAGGVDPAKGPGLARRGFLRGVGALSLAAPLATVLADPDRAAAAAARTRAVTLTTASGRTISAALAKPSRTPAPAVLLIHEWWGLNDQIKAVAAALAEAGYLALAVDLYGGQVAANGDADRARELMQAVAHQEAVDSLTAWMAWLRRHDGFAGKLGTVGWCFGGGWSLVASMSAAVDATVVYYGRVDFESAQLARLQGPVLGHFATEDPWINRAMVARYEAAMTDLEKPYQSHWYAAQHAFANPTSARYDQEDAALAWARTLAFFQARLAA